MNEAVARIGGQLRQAFERLRTAWKEMAPARKRLILIILLGVLALAVALVVVLNVVSGRYVVLYEGMRQDESVQALAALQNTGIDARLNPGTGQLEVPSKQQNAAMIQLAANGIPSTTLGYNIIAEASGLTTTEFEKQQYARMQWQDRLQDGIKTLNGVQNAIVNINLGSESNKVWDVNASTPTGAVQLTLMPGYVLSSELVEGIRYLVGNSVGIAPENVVVIDQNGNTLAEEGQAYDSREAIATQFITLLDLEAAAEQRLEANAREILSLPYPNPEDYRVAAKVSIDNDKMVQEIKEYFPVEGTNAGVLDEEELRAAMGLNQFAEGVVGETDNTDVPIYVDMNGDGTPEYVDFSQYRDYIVSYTLTQIERQSPVIKEASLSVVVAGAISDETRLSMRESMRTATNIPMENVSVQGYVVQTGEGIGGEGEQQPIPTLFIIIAGAAAVALVLVLVLVLVLNNRRKKKQLAEELAAAEAEQAEAERIQAEIEERKKQLKDAAIGDETENVIINEVREFARTNPEIAANLLRNWLKEGAD